MFALPWAMSRPPGPRPCAATQAVAADVPAREDLADGAAREDAPPRASPGSQGTADGHEVARAALPESSLLEQPRDPAERVG